MNEKQTLLFEDIRFEVPWGFVAGRWYGNRQVRPILALHGWQDNLGTWDRLMPLMTPHVGVLCIDLPGHGRSSKYPLGTTYHVMDYVHIIIRIIKEYNWPRVSLLGHSMGANICFIYAALYPHMVDMLIQIDLIKAIYRPIDVQMSAMRVRADRLIIENERLEQLHINEPPCYFYEEMEEALHRASFTSVAKENCKHLLNRSVANSKQYPEKFYFSRDARVKYYVECPSEHGLGLEMAKRICNIPCLLVRSDQESIMPDCDDELVEIFRANNPHYEFYRLEGTHHLQLDIPQSVAEIINPFILRHRPVKMDVKAKL